MQARPENTTVVCYRIDRDLWNRFLARVQKKHARSYGKTRTELEAALREYLDDEN